MDNCGLCKAYYEDFRVIYKNEDAVSLVIHRPVNEGHLMILPRRHILNLEEMTADEAKAVNEVLYKSQQRLAEKFPDASPIFAMQAGKNSTQPHIHYQMLPSDAHFRQLYTAAHKPGELVSIPMPKEYTHPPVGEDVLRLIAESLR